MFFDDAYQLQEHSKEVPGQQRKAHKSVTRVDYLSRLDFLSRAANVRLTGIICTIGPSSKKVETLVDMIEAGMDVARLNISHGTYDDHAEMILNIRKASKIYEEEFGFDPCVTIAIDLRGPEIRSGYIEGEESEVWLEKDSIVKLTSNPEFIQKCSEKLIYLDYKDLAKLLPPGRRIFIDDGLISIVATEVVEDGILGQVENGGFLGSKKGCNIPGTDMGLPDITEQDIEDIKFALEQDVDAIFVSYVHNSQTVQQVREIIRGLSAPGDEVMVIAKIEDEAGCINIADIIGVSDGIVVARGDMGIEIPAEKVFISQKQISAMCNRSCKPVICATQMIESMTKSGLMPTRTESSDVANAILDGIDCAMLSAETALGGFPISCIEVMSLISKEAEACLWSERFFEDIIRSEIMSGSYEEPEGGKDATHSTAICAVRAAYLIRAAAIVCITTSGKTAHYISKYKPKCPTIAVTRFPKVSRQLQFYRGIIPLHYREGRIQDWMRDVDERIQFGIDYGKKRGFIKSSDPIVCITGWRMGAGSSNTVRILFVN